MHDTLLYQDIFGACNRFLGTAFAYHYIGVFLHIRHMYASIYLPIRKDNALPKYFFSHLYIPNFTLIQT